MYVHLLEGTDRVVALPALARRAQRAYLLDGGAAVTVTQANDAITLTLPHRDTASPDQVVVLVLAGTTARPAAVRPGAAPSAR